jgi:MraZ protein
MFWGEYAHQLDSKGRLIIPARFRTHLTENAILTRGLDRNLVIYPETAWRTVTQQLNQMPITQPTSRALRRLLFSGAMEMTLDKQGRILLPAHLRTYASIQNEVLLVGMETFIEIWEPASWHAALEGVSSILADGGQSFTLSL